MINVKNKGKSSVYVYDISLDGTVVNALGLNICSNTDGFNFQLPNTFRYNEENPYIGKGLSRETKEGKAYTGFEADVAEFNDEYMSDKHYAPNAVNKMGLGIDEVVDSTINFSRKNYADYFPSKPYPEDVKMVGNTVKSKKMPEYIAVFLDKGIRLLLQGKGQEFLDEYYAYVDKIYNYQIPLKQIAAKGKIKKSIADYKEDCKTLTKAGHFKSRQAHMELAINAGLNVNLGETLYYINTGKSKSHGDLKKVTHYYMVTEDIFGLRKEDCKVKLEKEWKSAPDGKGSKTNLSFDEYILKHHPEVTTEDEIILNCHLLSREVIESEKDVYCSEGEEYNVPKYVEMFNKRITPLLVCFSRDIRDRILIDNPSNRPYFTEKECELVSGQPNKEGDQDTYEQLMTMEDKEIAFWLRHPEWEIPFINECDMNWEEIKADYFARQEREKQLGIDFVREKFFEAIKNMTSEDIDKFDDGILPASINKLVDIDPLTSNFVSKEYPDIVIGTIYDVLERNGDRLSQNAIQEVES